VQNNLLTKVDSVIPSHTYNPLLSPVCMRDYILTHVTTEMQASNLYLYGRWVALGCAAARTDTQ